MSRDSIIDEAEQKKQQETQSEPEPGEDESEEQEESRTRLTQRVPDDLLEDVEAVEEKYRLPSRNAAINFILTRGVEDLLNADER
jgi:hypothetical protein